MAGRDIIVVGASAGGVEALCQLVSDLPAIPAAIFVVLHLPSQSPSLLPKILNRSIKKSKKNSSLLAVNPEDGEQIKHGMIYVAPPDQHLLVKNGYIRLARGPRENSNRPAVDPLFRTAARAYGSRVVGIVLSGALDDGTAGLMAVKQQGGIAVVQDPEEALYPSMPQSAIENVEVDHVLRLGEIVPVLVKLASEQVEEAANPVSDDMEIESDMAELELGAMQKSDRPGKPSPYACPDCNGVLWELEDGIMRFRCRTGHAYSSKSLLAAMSEAQEEALWNALRALEEKAALIQKMADRAQECNQTYSAQRFAAQATDAQERATIVRQMLLNEHENRDLSSINGKIVGSNELELIVQANHEGNGSKHAQVLTPAPPRPSPSPLSPITFYAIAIGASAGGLNALNQVLSDLPTDLPAAIVVVQHISAHYPSHLSEILNRHSKWDVKSAAEGDVLCPGKIYVAPPDQHLLVNPDHTISLSKSALVHFVRPSADLLFESVAANFKQRAIAIVLTGTGSDGSMGIKAIKQMGGVAIAQDQETAEFFNMPKAAIDTGGVDWVVPLNQIATTIVNLVQSTLR